MLELIRIDGLAHTDGGVGPFTVALGNFDGVHLGHAEIIKSTVGLAKSLSAEPAVFSFDVHPQLYFGNRVRLITSEEDRFALFRSYGVKYIIKASFEEFKDTEPCDFLSALKDRINCIGACCGYNFRFGKGGKGSSDDVRSFFGDGARIVDRFTLGGEDVCSSKIRALTECGRVNDAALLLGRAFSVEGTVVSGRRIGRQMNFPTANIIIDGDMLAPGVGIYATFARVDGKIYPSVTNYGNNPTVTEKTDKILETHIIGFDGDIYGKSIRVYFLEKIREQKKFSSLEELRGAILEDKNTAERICSDMGDCRLIFDFEYEK